MSKLKDYYRLFDMFKGKLTKEQKEVLGQLEDQIIAEEVLPAINESVAPILTTLRRKLSIVVNYDPESGVIVKTTRGEVVVKEHTAKNYNIPATKKVVAEANKKPAIRRSPATGLCVWLKNGEFIQADKACHTMADAIEMAGPRAVAELHIPHDGDYLVSKEKHHIYANNQQQLSDGYLLNTHSNTATKKKQLDRISAALHLGWRVEIIK